MRLSLSTGAAPDVALDALLAACRARGLDGIELVVHANAASLVESTRESGARVVALRAEVLDAGSAEGLAKMSAALGVPVSVPAGAAPRESLPALAKTFDEAAGRLLLGHGTRLDEVVERLAAIEAIGAPRSIGLAWDIRPSGEPLGEAGAVLLAARDKLGLVRLHGGGPEQRAQDGLGIGPLFVDLALSAYAGAIVLCPSSPAELPGWQRWLSSQKSAGCSQACDSSELQVDVRDVEPKDRFELIVGAYRALAPGATLHLTLDHDPSCMYYTLQATEPAGSFSFLTLDHGPEVWRADVTKR